MTKHKKTLSVYIHMLRNSSIGFSVILIALYAGMLGYHEFEGMPWVDAFLNASMILSGMGPAATLTTQAGKIFAGCYALFSGLAFIAIVVVMLSPIIHHFFRKLNFQAGNED